MTPNLLGLCGSLRAASLNKKLMREAFRHFGDATVSEGDLNLPLYNGDDEERDGLPASVQRLIDQVAAADAVVIATPEYNQALTGVLKNALDWISRSKNAPWRDKPVALVSATAGRAGGARAQYSLRLCMMPFRAHVLTGPEVMVAAAAKQFDADGRLTPESYATLLAELMSDLRRAAVS